MRSITLKRFNIIFLRNKYASIGIGAMIVFIAMVLVAGIAASVLINTSNQLEAQALRTGLQTKNEVSSDITVLKVTGQFGNRSISGVYYPRFHNMTIQITPKSASEIDLTEVFTLMSDGSKIIQLNWDNTKYASEPAATGVFSTSGLFDLNSSQYGIIVVEDADGSCTATNPVINDGDKVLLTVNLSAVYGGLTLRTKIQGQVISEFGAPGIFLFETPATTIRTIVDFM